MQAALERTTEDTKFKDQLSGAVIDNINNTRIVDEALKLNAQDLNFLRANGELNKVVEFIKCPEKILGCAATKHGEIAEQVEVGVRRANQALNNETMTATFDGVGRTAPEDYIIDGIAAQSKFLNGTNNNLSAVLGHMDKYSEFGRDGSYYHIPKDEFQTIEKIINGESVDGLNQKTINAIQEKVAKIEEETGKSFTEVVKPGVSDYAEIQQGKVSETLDKHKEEISEENKEIKEKISQDHEASLAEGFKAAAVAGAVGAAVSLTTSLYKKNKEGKKFYKGDFTAQDWKDVGISTSQGGAIGAISGGAIYGLTNYASLSAPFAGAVVSAAKGIGSLINDLNKGEISKDEFTELGMVICSEAAIVGFATAAGQAAIPIPVLGAVIGSIAGSMLANFLGDKNKKTAYVIRQEMNEYIQQLDNTYKKLVSQILAEFEKLGELTKAAFDIQHNYRLVEASLELAKAYGVKESKMIKTSEDLDAFILG